MVKNCERSKIASVVIRGQWSVYLENEKVNDLVEPKHKSIHSHELL